MTENTRQPFTKAPLLLIALLFCAWQLPGVIGRSPWKSDEAYTTGLVHHMMQSGDLVVPQLGGEPFMQKPPLFFIVASACAKMFAPVFPPHVGARFATMFFNALTMLFIGLAARELNGRGRGWPAAVLSMACIGPLHMAHFILTDYAMLTGIALGLHGMALGLRRAWAGGFVCGTGAGIAFMTKGLVGTGLLGLTVLLLPLCDAAWRNKNWLRFTAGCVLAALPWAVLWPLALYLRSPELFNEWFLDNNIGRFLHLPGHDVNGPKAVRGYMFAVLPWYAFPASALAAWTLWREGRTGFSSSALRMPLIFLAAGLFVFTASRDGRELYALPLVAPLLLLGARRLDDFSETAGRRLNAAVFTLFSVVAIIAWLLWCGMLAGAPSFVSEKMQSLLPGFVPSFQAVGFSAAMVLTAAWFFLKMRHQPATRFFPVHFAAGVALLYGLGMTLFLPVAEWQMSYERQFVPLRAMLPPASEVVLSRGLGEPQRAMLDYFAGLQTRRLEKEKRKYWPDLLNRHSWLLMQTNNTDKADPSVPLSGWDQVWEERHEGERFRLFRKTRS